MALGPCHPLDLGNEVIADKRWEERRSGQRSASNAEESRLHEGILVPPMSNSLSKASSLADTYIPSPNALSEGSGSRRFHILRPWRSPRWWSKT